MGQGRLVNILLSIDGIMLRILGVFASLLVASFPAQSVRADMCGDIIISAAGGVNPDPRRNPSHPSRKNKGQPNAQGPIHQPRDPDTFELAIGSPIRQALEQVGFSNVTGIPKRSEINERLTQALASAEKDLKDSRSSADDRAFYTLELNKVKDAIENLVRWNLADPLF